MQWKGMINRAFLLRIISVLMVLALVIVIIIGMSGTEGSNKPVNEVAVKVVPLFENDRAAESPERILKKNYGYNAADFDGVVLYSPISNMDAEELLIVKMNSEAQAEGLMDAVMDRRSNQMNVYEGYAPEEYQLCKDAVIDHQGNYLLYVVHKDADKIDAAFRDALK